MTDNPMTRRTISRGPQSNEKMTVTSFGDLDESETELKEVMQRLNIPMDQDPTKMREVNRQARLRSKEVDYGENTHLQHRGVQHGCIQLSSQNAGGDRDHGLFPASDLTRNFGGMYFCMPESVAGSTAC
jgi:hypothetical protein